MISFLLSVLVILLYAAVAMLVIYAIAYFFQKIFGEPIPPRILQLIYCIVALLFVIWFVQSLLTHTPIPAPWQWERIR